MQGGTEIAFRICESWSDMAANIASRQRHRGSWMTRVLVAEDDTLMRWSLEKFLTQHGHMVHSVGSGHAAIDASKSGEYRVVITDYAMPGSDGFEVLREIKKQVPQTHVIFIT